MRRSEDSAAVCRQRVGACDISMPLIVRCHRDNLDRARATGHRVGDAFSACGTRFSICASTTACPRARGGNCYRTVGSGLRAYDFGSGLAGPGAGSPRSSSPPHRAHSARRGPRVGAKGQITARIMITERRLRGERGCPSPRHPLVAAICNQTAGFGLWGLRDGQLG
jgi:hypothetical protein